MSKEFFFQRYHDLGQNPKEISIRQSIRVSPHIDEPTLIKRLNRAGIILDKIPYAQKGYVVKQAKISIGATAEYLLGYYYIQESASQLPVQILFENPSTPNEIIIDCCSAPGGKTTQIAAYHKGPILALEKVGQRIYAVKNHAERMGITNIALYKKDARYCHELGVEFDRILVDAPCSGNFVTDDQWFGKRSVEMFMENQRRQKEILKSAFRSLKKGGTLVYSTCSLEPEENEHVVDWALKTFEGLSLEPVNTIGDPGLLSPFGKPLDSSIFKTKRFWPWKTWTQGFFIAKFVKR